MLNHHLTNALRYYINTGNIEQVKEILKYNICINSQDDLGNTPLMMACQMESLILVKLIINEDPDLEIENNKGETALLYCCKHNLYEITSILVEAGAYVKYHPSCVVR